MLRSGFLNKVPWQSIFRGKQVDLCHVMFHQMPIAAIFLHSSYIVDQWFSTFLVEWNPNETFQRLEEPLCSNFIVLCQGGPTSALLWATFQNYLSLRAVTG